MFFTALCCCHPRIRRIVIDMTLQSLLNHGLWPEWFSGLCSRWSIGINAERLDNTTNDSYIPDDQLQRKVSADLDLELEDFPIHCLQKPFNRAGVVS